MNQNNELAHSDLSPFSYPFIFIMHVFLWLIDKLTALLIDKAMVEGVEIPMACDTESQDDKRYDDHHADFLF